MTTTEAPVPPSPRGREEARKLCDCVGCHDLKALSTCTRRDRIAAALATRDQEIETLRTQLDAVTRELAEVNEFRAKPFKAFRAIVGDDADMDDEALAGSIVAVLLTRQQVVAHLRKTRADLLALQVEHGRVREKAERVAEISHAPKCLVPVIALRQVLSSSPPSGDVVEAVKAIADAIEDEWCHGTGDEKHARGDCTACNLASALRALGLGPKP